MSTPQPLSRPESRSFMYDSGFDFNSNDVAMSRFLEAIDRVIAAAKAVIAANTAYMNRPRFNGPIVLSNRDCDALFGAIE